MWNLYLEHLALESGSMSAFLFFLSPMPIAVDRDGHYHGIDQLDAIVLRWVVTGGDHHAHGLAPQFS
jgi:hypothetical protein